MRILTTIVLTLFIATLSLQAQDYDKLIIENARHFNKALLDKDYEAYVATMNPHVVKAGGGEEFMMQAEKEKMQVFESGGMKYVSIEPIKVIAIAKEDDGIQGILMQKVILSLADSKFQRNVYFHAYSEDGVLWKYLDLEPFSETSITDYIPNFSEKLVIPAPEIGEAIKNE